VEDEENGLIDAATNKSKAMIRDAPRPRCGAGTGRQQARGAAVLID
jgi:hypothetical protein